MHPVVRAKLPELAKLCERYHVRQLELFGSAATDRFDPATSDVDFLVVFDEPPDGGAGRQYLEFLMGLEKLFERDVDLVELSAVKNPYFLEVAAKTRQTIYAA